MPRAIDHDFRLYDGLDAQLPAPEPDEFGLWDHDIPVINVPRTNTPLICYPMDDSYWDEGPTLEIAHELDGADCDVCSGPCAWHCAQEV